MDQGRARPVLRALTGAAVLVVIAGLVGLGVWQVRRLSWKLDLIARVDRRIHASPLPMPGPAEWPAITATADEYRHVEVGGLLLNDRETLVQAVSEYGAGFWILTPLRTASGDTVLINRGFIPPDRRAPSSRAASEIVGPTTVEGLLRMSEPRGGFLRSNDAGADRWFSRDVAAIAARRGLERVAPFFIDADAVPNPGGLPIGGLTVIAFPNNHLVYAITWFTLAAMLTGAMIWVVRENLRRRRRLPDLDVSAQRSCDETSAPSKHGLLRREYRV